jgi:GT2 family glycosyltransferase
LWRAISLGREEDQLKVVYGTVLRLPVSEQTRQKLLRRGISWVLDRRSGEQHGSMQEAHALWHARGKLELDRLLSSNELIQIPSSGPPLVTFVVVVRDKAHLSFLSLESISQFADVPYELIVVDNASADATAAMLDRFQGARIIRNATNAGFGPACNQAANSATGEYLCFFNNDALITPGAVRAVLSNFEQDHVGAVGAKILLANGALQEAGSIIWRDGSALGYGRGDDPGLPRYNFRRPVDYCSGVFMVTPRELFLKLGGFSDEFAPAYYEDTDYCMTLWHNGWKVIYEPTAMIQHYESATSGGNQHAMARMAAHQLKFSKKWELQLRRHFPPEVSNVPAARFAAASKALRIVYVEDRVPKRGLGSGYPRSNEIITQMNRMGHLVVCATSTFPLLADEHGNLPREVETFDGCRFREELVNQYMNSADIVWVSRPHNMKILRSEFPTLFANRQFALVYDSEAVFTPRAQARTELLGNSATNPMEPTGLDEEIALAKLADAVVVVGDADRQLMLNSGVASVHVVGHALTASPTPASFHERDSFLFVGAMHGHDNPNADSIREFYRKHWARIHEETGGVFLVAGFGTDQLNAEIADPTFQILGPREDLRPLYNRARVFVVPTRYAAGIPFKAHEAAAHGVPMVVSPVIAQQLRWEHGSDYLAANDLGQMAVQCIRLYRDRELWERTRTNSLGRVSTELSPEAFVDRLREVLDEVTNVRTSV